MSNPNDNQQITEERKKITLIKPENSNKTNIYTVDANTDFVLGFDIKQATISRNEDGDLIFTFTDINGYVISIIIKDFYDVYNANALPTFFIPSSDSGGLTPLPINDIFNNDASLMPAPSNEKSLADDPTGTNPINPSLLANPEPANTPQSRYNIPNIEPSLGQDSFPNDSKESSTPNSFFNSTENNNEIDNDSKESSTTDSSSDSTENNNEIEALVADNSNENNIITKTTGADTLVIKADINSFSMSALNGGKNEINTGDDNDSITLNGTMYAVNKGTNSINLDAGDDKLQISGNVRSVYNGTNTINGGDDDDFIWIEGDFLTKNGGTNTINGGADDDLIKLSNSGLSFNDVLIDGGENASDGTTEMDVLLTGVSNIDSIKSAINKKNITNIEVAINGDVQGESVKEVLNNLGVTQNGDKLTFNNPTDWIVDKNSGLQDYTEYTKTEADGDTITLLIQTGIL